MIRVLCLIAVVLMLPAGLLPQQPAASHAQTSVPYMVMTRMGPTDKSLFRWKGLDGSTVLVWNTLKGYGWGTFLTSKQTADPQKIERMKKDLDDVRARVTLYGDVSPAEGGPLCNQNHQGAHGKIKNGDVPPVAPWIPDRSSPLQSSPLT